MERSPWSLTSKPSPSSKVKRPAVLRAAGPIRVPRCEAPISMGAPSTAIFFARLEFEASFTASPLIRLYYARECLAKDSKRPFSSPRRTLQAFDAILGVNAQPQGTKFSDPHSGTRPPPAVHHGACRG